MFGRIFINVKSISFKKSTLKIINFIQYILYIFMHTYTF